MHGLALGLLVGAAGALMGALGAAWAAARQSRIDRDQRLDDEWRARVNDALWTDRDRDV